MSQDTRLARPEPILADLLNRGGASKGKSPSCQQ
jgi:hypothetical protein